jgi:hypothetical protein
MKRIAVANVKSDVSQLVPDPPDLSCKRGACASHLPRQADPAPPALTGRGPELPF